MSDRPLLARLAQRAGILPDYLSFDGRERRETSDSTRAALLSAMGFDASTESAVSAELSALELADSRRLLDSVRVVDENCQVDLFLDSPLTGVQDVGRRFSARVEREDGSVCTIDGSLSWSEERRACLARLGDPWECGYYRVALVVAAPPHSLEGTQWVIVAPSKCTTVAEKVGNARWFGLWANLYSVRSDENCGFGDLSDLQELIHWSARIGAAFVGINPLHATRNVFPDISPYRPLSRLFRNPLYLRLSAFPEWGELPVGVRAGDDGPSLERAKSRDDIDYDAIGVEKFRVFRRLYQAFCRSHRGQPSARGREYDAYRKAQGGLLSDFATFCVLDGHFRQACGITDWRFWPADYRDPRAESVTEFRRQHLDEVELHCYLQFEMDLQLAAARDGATHHGLPIGLYHDLAVGSAPDGADAWMFSNLFVRGASIGAPPDDLAPLGQDWGLPPMNPLRLRKSGYGFWIRLLRASFAHAGALRIDHVMGLLRQFWIPEGMPGRDGAYVAFPAEELLAIVALESRRAGAIVVGEDLGTVPHGFDELLQRWGILSTRVLYFEKDHTGRFRAPHELSPRAVVCVHTHDLPPLAGFWNGQDLTLRRAVGQLPSEAEAEAARQRRSHEKLALSARLRDEGLLATEEPRDSAELVTASYALLSRSPAPLVAVSLDDLALETEPVNLPGATPDQHPSWSRRMHRSIGELRDSADASRILRAVADRAVHGPKRNA